LGPALSHHFGPIYCFRYRWHILRFMDLERWGVPMELDGNGWNSARLIYRDHRMVVPIDLQK
jgi:hypothetical protein